MASRIYLYLVLTLHTAILLPLPSGVSAVAPKISLRGKSFSLSATLDNTRHHNDKQQETWRYYLEELHSGWQLQSKVRYRLAGGSPASELIRGLPVQVRESGTFFADQQQLLVMNEAARLCEAPAGGRELIERLFTDDLLNGFAFEGHLIGAGRLLHFVDANRDKFQHNANSQLGDTTISQYSATLKVAQAGASFEVTLLYNDDDSGAGQMWAGIPRSITIRRQPSLVGGRGQHARVLKFTFERIYELTPAGRPLYGRLEAGSQHWAGPVAGGDRDQRGQALAFDLFAVERSIGCSRVMATPTLATMDMASTEPHGFTLTARVGLQMIEEPLVLTVGYEPSLQTLKVRKAGETRTTEMLTNFRQNRCYYSTSRRAGATKPDLILDSILQIGNGGSGGGGASSQVDSTCVVARASRRRDMPAGKDSSHWSGDKSIASPHTQGQLLLGADRLVYMGMARVRGIQANVYESYDSQFPVWLQSPAVYQPAGGDQLRWRVNAPEGDQAPPGLLTTVFYFSRRGRTSENLLLVEIFKSARPNLGEGGSAVAAAAAAAVRKDTITIPIYDFKWRGSGASQALAPNGMRMENFYSLGADQCLAAASRAQNQYARLDLLLESLVGSKEADASGVYDWIGEPSKRNLALMRALQEQLNVPSQFVYDLESRQQQQQQEARSGVKVLQVSLRLAQRQETRSDLHLLGTGQFRAKIRHRFRMFLASSFQACHMIAAQRKSDLILFLFDPIRWLCYLYKPDTRQLPDDDKKRFEYLLEPDQQPGPHFRSLEAYKIVKNSDITIAFQNEQATGNRSDEKSQTESGQQTIEQLRERLVALRRALYLTDPSLEPPPVSDEKWAPAKSHFKIVSYALDLIDQKSVAQVSDNESGQQLERDSNKFPGFGLVLAESDGDEQSHFVGAKWVSGPEGKRPGQMTYEQCQTACLASADCRAYSTCILDGQMQCLVTGVSFRSRELVAQLMMLERKPAKAGAIFSLDVNSATQADEQARLNVTRQVHVMRHPSCELHNKSYRDLFKEPARRVSVGLAGRILQPVGSLEQCARLCFTSTWEFMREQSGGATGDNNSKMSAHIRRKLTQEAIADLAKWARDYRESICDSFLYLDLDEIKRLPVDGTGPSALDALKAKIQGSNHEGPTRGYCVIEKPLEVAQVQAARGEKRPEVKQQALIGAAQFEFNFLTLYEATPGVSLSESAKSDAEKDAYYSVSYARVATPEKLRAITLLLERGDNSGQARPASSAAECARECFQQLMGPTPWPACRSFSFMEVWHTERGKLYAFCLYNSITLRQAHAQERFDLVRDQPGSQDRICVLESELVRIWHYDPKPGLLASSLDQVYHMSLDEMQAAAAAAGAHLANSTGVHIGPLGLIMSLVLIFIPAVALGVWLGSQYYLKRAVGLQVVNRRPSDADQLVNGGFARRPRPVKVVFENAHHKPAD